jgi:hypothetical protein
MIQHEVWSFRMHEASIACEITALPRDWINAIKAIEGNNATCSPRKQWYVFKVEGSENSRIPDFFLRLLPHSVVTSADPPSLVALLYKDTEIGPVPTELLLLSTISSFSDCQHHHWLLITPNVTLCHKGAIKLPKTTISVRYRTPNSTPFLPREKTYIF